MNIDNKWVNQMSKWALSDPAALKYFLNIMTKCPDYSLNNQLLLMYQSQERPFTMLKAQDVWERQGVSVNQDAAYYYIWEPDKDENGEVIYIKNSREPAGYHYKYMYDVNDTNYTYVQPQPTSLQALEALLTRHKPPVEVVDEIKNIAGARAMYSPKDKAIYVVRSSKVPADDFFTAIVTEMGHAICHSQMKDTTMTYNRAYYHFTCCTAAYALASKYNVSTAAVNIDILPDRLIKMGERTAKNELTRLARINKTIDGDIRMPMEKICMRDTQMEQEVDRHATGT
jgi:hypothetical protein